MNPGPPPCEGGVLTRLDDGPSRPWGLQGTGLGLQAGGYIS